jgi:VanZ family protein
LGSDVERAVRAWVPAVVYVGLIFAVSSIPGSVFCAMHFKIFDKAAHMVEFTGLGLFLMIAFRGSLPEALKRRAVLFALGAGVLVGFMDELYQLAVPGRSVELLDWVADVIGVVVGSTVAMIHYRARNTA